MREGSRKGVVNRSDRDLHLRLSSQQYSKVAEIARRKWLPMSTWVKMLIQKAIEEDEQS